MRSNYWDGWKGVAIIAVVAIHASAELGNFPAESFNWYFGLVFRQFINFAVPLFLALAGFFAVRSSTDFGLDYYRKRLMRVLPPYLFWTVVFVLLKHPSHFFSPGALSKDIFLGTGIGIGYFVIVLVQFMSKVKERERGQGQVKGVREILLKNPLNLICIRRSKCCRYRIHVADRKNFTSRRG